jgi:hypothetical protein
MRQLDEAVRPLVTKLVLAGQTVIEIDEQSHLADWACKTALVWITKEPAERQKALGVTALYSDFGSAKHPLPGMHVWLGHREHDDGGWFRAFSLDRTNLPIETEVAGAAFGAVLAIRHLVVLVLHNGTPGLEIALVGNASAAMARIFPPSGQPISLPLAYGWPGADLSALPSTVTRYVRMSPK